MLEIGDCVVCGACQLMGMGMCGCANMLIISAYEPFRGLAHNGSRGVRWSDIEVAAVVSTIEVFPTARGWASPASIIWDLNVTPRKLFPKGLSDLSP